MSDTQEATASALDEAFPGMQDVTPEQVQDADEKLTLDHELLAANPELAALLGQTDKDIVNFIPDRPGKSVVGKLVDITEVDSDYHRERDSVPMLVIEGPSGTLWGVRCYHTVLLNEVERRIEKGRLNIGDLVAVKYLGKGGKEDRSLQQYDNYRLSVKPAPKQQQPVS